MRIDPTLLSSELEASLCAVECHLAALGEALRERDTRAIERHAGELQRALAAAIQRFSCAARTGDVPPSLRQRLALAGGQVAAQRESLARATAALDRAIDVLLPQASGRGYCASGIAERAASSGCIQA
jgi:hypothetical protein